MKLRPSLLIFSIFLLIACATDTGPSMSYLAINGKDTATLKLNIMENRFFGTFQINSPGGRIDSGNVRGDVKGDTLIGSFNYIPHGMANAKIKPIALLKGKNGEFIQGKGHIAVYMHIPYFWENTPIKYDDPKFIFKPVL